MGSSPGGLLILPGRPGTGPAGYGFGPAVGYPLEYPVSGVLVTDVNGDAIDDIVVLERGATESTVHVYTQCTSRNAFACAPVPGLGQGQGTK